MTMSSRWSFFEAAVPTTASYAYKLNSGRNRGIMSEGQIALGRPVPHVRRKPLKRLRHRTRPPCGPYRSYLRVGLRIVPAVFAFAGEIRPLTITGVRPIRHERRLGFGLGGAPQTDFTLFVQPPGPLRQLQQSRARAHAFPPLKGSAVHHRSSCPCCRRH